MGTTAQREPLKQRVNRCLLKLSDRDTEAMAAAELEEAKTVFDVKLEKKAEKTVFDVKLEKIDAAARIKIIKEIRTFTDLGLKEAKELPVKAPVILKQSLTKEEAETIIGKIKAAGGVAVME